MRNIAILGTASDVGKSLVATVLCRILKNRHVDVAPYKAQNMSNNSFVTHEGGEMGRAQVVQAQAAKVSPSVHMNPVLLKPSQDTMAQVILQGKVLDNREAKDYFSDTQSMRSIAYESLRELQNQHEVIVLEGAGSCAELNLRARDFVNFDAAHAADADVFLVADIDRGGVFAQIIGTLAILNNKDRQRVKGVIINRFRGDASLFSDGMKMIEEQTQVPVVGFIPYLHELNIDCEDGFGLEFKINPKENLETAKIKIAILHFPHISNFTDFAVFENDPMIQCHYLSDQRDLNSYDLVIIPGSKNVPKDLIHARKWLSQIKSFEGQIMAICGGLQILGERISDPEGIEGKVGTFPGLDLLPLSTELQHPKITRQTSFKEALFGEQVKGYEIHHGRTKFTDNNIEHFAPDARDGIIHQNITATYLHGVFDDDAFRLRFLQKLKESYQAPQQTIDPYEQLAAHFEKHLNMELILND